MNAVDSTTEDTTASTTKPQYDAGTWQATLDTSRSLFERSGKARTKASTLLWEGAQEATNEWMSNGSDTDVNAEALYGDVIAVLGKSRKGDASKIKTVALAVKNNGLILTVYPNLAKAYQEAKRLTTTVQTHAAEDTAAEKAVEDIASAAPKSSSTPEGAAMIVLSKGVDEAARLLLDALGATNTAAHRALMRAISDEIGGRIKAAAPKPAAKKATTKKATTTKRATAPKPGSGAAKPKPVAGAAKPKPVAEVAAKPKPVAVAPEATPDDIMFGGEPEAEAEVVSIKAKPVRRGPVTG